MLARGVIGTVFAKQETCRRMVLRRTRIDCMARKLHIYTLHIYLI